METKKYKLVLLTNKYEELKKDVYVIYTCYSMHRTTFKALGKIKNVTDDGNYVLGNQEYYTAKQLQPVLLYVVTDDPIKLEDKFIDLENYWNNGEFMTAGEHVDLHLVNELKSNYKKVIATNTMIGYSKNISKTETSCHLCVKVETFELNNILEQGGKCEIEMKDNKLKLVNNKITFIFRHQVDF